MISVSSLPMKRLRGLALAGCAGLASLGLGLTLAPHQARAWWNGGVWVAGPGYYPPPVVVAPPPVYYAPPPVVYAPPQVVYPAAPPPAYFPPAPVTESAPVVAGGACVTPARTCSMTVARSPGAPCYCTDSYGQQVWGSVR